MDNFITLNYMGTFIGMVAIIVLITQFSKDLVDKYLAEIPTKYVVFIYSLVVIIGYQLMSNTFEPKLLLLTLFNAILLTMTAQGGYEWLYKPVEMKYANKGSNASANIKELPQDTNISVDYNTKPINHDITNTNSTAAEEATVTDQK